jgi:hypothetical protein
MWAWTQSRWWWNRSTSPRRRGRSWMIPVQSRLSIWVGLLLVGCSRGLPSLGFYTWKEVVGLRCHAFDYHNVLSSSLILRYSR